ncbi:MAG: ferredoxin [Desulfosarcinaceae bacterium]|nr:ferredoxin [Desulfosarcinaceae bacterium]
MDRNQGLIVGILQANIPGKYHVDERCIGCAICAEIAPHNLCFDHAEGYAYVYRQPGNDSEASRCAEVVDICPVSAIGDNGTGGNFGPA